jgi:hypothetical protein
VLVRSQRFGEVRRELRELLISFPRVCDRTDSIELREQLGMLVP